MVVIPQGRFRMGAPIDRPTGSSCGGGGSGCEKPVHTVTIGYKLAVGTYEVTFDEWDACVAGRGCGGHRPDDEGWGRGRRPVINVSWDDAQGYVSWLSRKTGKSYRFLSEAEWEYVARAGTTTVYNTGSSISIRQANSWDSEYKKTRPVGSYDANAFGLYDVHGNVWEWVNDCHNVSYAGAPGDGGAWLRGDCSVRVRRGAAWSLKLLYLRSAIRSGSTTRDRSYNLGFRVARTL